MRALEELKSIDQWVAYTHKSKIPIGPNGVAASTTDPKTWGTVKEAWWVKRVQGLEGIGFAFSPDDPYVGIDLDDAISKNGNLYDWAKEIVDGFKTYAELSPSGTGIHLICRGSIPQGAKYRDEDGIKIEIYSRARYFTMTGKKLPGSIDEICEIELADFYEKWFSFDVRDRIETGWEAPDIADWLGDALYAIGGGMDYHTWIKIGMAIKGHCGDSGFSYWDNWSATSIKYEGEKKTLRKWDSLPTDSKVSIATVIWMAQESGFTMPDREHILSGLEWSDWLDAHNEIEEPATGLKTIWINASSCYEDRSPFEPDLISPGVLGTGDIMLVFGPPKSMKSMMLMDACRAWSMGKNWFDFTVDRPLKIAYMQFEIKRDQLRKRLQLAQLSKEELDLMRSNLFFTDRFTPMLDANFTAGFAESVLECFKGALDVLVIDPIANIYTGDNENDNAQMSLFLRQVKVLRNAIDPSLAVILVHHASKGTREERTEDPFNSIRGAGSLRAAYDTGIYIDRVSQETEARKMWIEVRNGEGMMPLDLSFKNGRFTANRLDVLAFVLEASLEGRLYTFNSIVGALGSDFDQVAIKTELKRLFQDRALEVVYEAPNTEDANPRSHGYIVVDGMNFGGEKLVSTHFKRYAGSKGQVFPKKLIST